MQERRGRCASRVGGTALAEMASGTKKKNVRILAARNLSWAAAAWSRTYMFVGVLSCKRLHGPPGGLAGASLGEGEGVLLRPGASACLALYSQRVARAGVAQLAQSAWSPACVLTAKLCALCSSR